MSKNEEFHSQKALHDRKDTTVFDLDGTLADNMTYEKHHKGLKGKHPDFAKEAKSVGTKKSMVNEFHEASKHGKVVVLTARSAHYRPETEEWLKKNDIDADSLIMRPSDSKKSDAVVKKELLEEDVLPKYDVKKAYDDKEKNRKMYRSVGIKAKGVK